MPLSFHWLFKFICTVLCCEVNSYFYCMIFNITSLAMTDDTFPILYGIVQTADVSPSFRQKSEDLGLVRCDSFARHC